MIVFVIDDDASVRRALTRLFKSAGHRVQAFDSAREFLAAKIESDEPSCLVLDVNMPEVTGIELQREMHSMGRNLPIVFITGHSEMPMTVNTAQASAVDFLSKPFKDTDLLRAIERAIAGADRDRAASGKHDRLLGV